MDSASTRVEGEELFFPPLRVVRFNPNLTEDDGLLVESVRSASHHNTTDAKRAVQRMVLDLRQQLLADGQADFGSIGLFLQDEDGHVTFEPCQAGAVTPAYFGLDAFSMPRLSTLQKSTLKVVQRKADVVSDNDSHITIRLNRRSLRYVAATVAAVFIGLLFSSPQTEPLNQPQQATIVPVENVEKPLPKAVTPKPVVQSQAEQQPVAVTSETEAQPVAETAPAVSQPAETPQPAVKADEGYCIVLASDVSQKNAEAFVERLQKKGFEHVRIYDNGKLRRVIIDGFATEGAAYERNAQIHRLGGEFATSWVMKL